MPRKRVRKASPAQSADAAGDAHPSVLSLIRGIQDGSVNPKLIATDDRRRCVEHLTAEGYSKAEIAEILRTPERTIGRDRQAIREAHAIESDPGLVAETVGGLILEAELAITRIRRAIRGTDTPPMVRIEGERACWATRRELVQLLQRLGYLPTSPQEIRGDLTHHLDDGPGLEELQGQVDVMAAVVKRCHSDDKTGKGRVAQLRAAIARLALSERIEDATRLLEQEKPDEPKASK